MTKLEQQRKNDLTCHSTKGRRCCVQRSPTPSVQSSVPREVTTEMLWLLKGKEKTNILLTKGQEILSEIESYSMEVKPEQL